MELWNVKKRLLVVPGAQTTTQASSNSPKRAIYRAKMVFSACFWVPAVYVLRHKSFTIFFKNELILRVYRHQMKVHRWCAKRYWLVDLSPCPPLIELYYCKKYVLRFFICHIIIDMIFACVIFSKCFPTQGAWVIGR